MDIHIFFLPTFNPDGVVFAFVGVITTGIRKIFLIKKNGHAELVSAPHLLSNECARQTDYL
jgi:hypothetical protein